MALGFLGLMSEAVLTSVSFRPLEGLARKAAIQRHMYWQIGAVTCITGGFAAIELNKVGRCCVLMQQSDYWRYTAASCLSIIH